MFFPRLKEVGISLLPEERIVESDVVKRQLLPKVGLYYLEDAGDQYHYVSRSRLRELGVSEGQLHQQAIANLRQFALDNAKVSPASNGITTVHGMGELESSLCLVPDTIVRYGFIPGKVVFGMPSRDIFAFCGAENQPAISRLKSICQSHFEKEARSRRISPRLFKASDSGEPIRFAGEFSNLFASLASTLFGRG